MYISIDKKTSNNKEQQGGFAMIEIAIVLVLFSLLSAGFIANKQPVNRETQYTDTRANMEKVIDAAAMFMQKYSRLPCPADPAEVNAGLYGLERNYGWNAAAAANMGDCTGGINELVGIVPFKTLGLPEEMVRDEWGNYFTFRVSSGGQINYAPYHPGNNPYDVGAHCRVKEGSQAHLVGGHTPWVITAGNSACQQNINPIAAQFCCPTPDPSFAVVDDYNNELVDSSAGGGANAQKLHVPQTANNLPANIPANLALVLVSHGSNNFGAFIGNGDGNIIGAADFASYTADERENADGDGNFIFHHMINSDANYYDDIILYRTNQMLMTELGGPETSVVCSNPPPYQYPGGDNCGQGNNP
jgi:hypothetical protein